MANIKENAVRDFIDMIKKSWTYDKMTKKERYDFLELFGREPYTVAIIGSYRQRWAICNAIYDAYLTGIGYDGPNWRDPHPEESPF